MKHWYDETTNHIDKAMLKDKYPELVEHADEIRNGVEEASTVLRDAAFDIMNIADHQDYEVCEKAQKALHKIYIKLTDKETDLDELPTWGLVEDIDQEVLL